MITDRHPGSVIEIGAGKGAIGARIARSARYVGVEPDEQSRLVAQAAVGRHGGIVVDALGAIDAQSRFGMLCAFEVLEHIDDDVGALQEWCEHVAADGFVLLSVPAHRSRFGASDVRVGHFRRYDRSDVSSLMSSAGLRLERIWSTGWPIGHLLETAWNTAARIRPSEGTIAARSSESGRWFQPSRLVAPLWFAIGTPSVWMQRRRFTTDAGTGWVILCRRL